MKTGIKCLMTGLLATAILLTTACSAPTQTGGSETTTQAPEGETYELMFGHAQTETHPYQEAFLNWADAVAERTDGGLTIDVYASNTLGSEEDIINSFNSSDTNWGYNTDFARLGTYVPNLALFNLPYFVEDMDDIQAVKELDLTKEWIAQLESDFDIKVVSLNLVQGYRNVVTGREVRTPADLQGLTLRSPNTDIWRAAVTSLGCSVQGMGRGDIYNNLVNKVIDGYEDVYPCVVSESYYEIGHVNIISETHSILLMNPVVVDAGWFNSLPASYQTALIEACDEAMNACSQEMLGSYTEESKQKCIDEGMTIIEYADIDIDAFRESSMSAYETLGLTEIYNEVKAALAA